MNKTKKITLVGIFAALAAVLMYVEFPLWFAPPFYKIDFSEVPVMICGFMLGPVAGFFTELVKIIIKLIINPTSTAFVGEFANFTIGCMFVIPASLIYKYKKSKKSAAIGMGTGTVVMTVAGCFINAFIMLPFYAKFYGNMTIDDLIGMGTAVNPAIKDMPTFIVLGVVPVNLIKGVLVTAIVMLIYKNISKLIKAKL